jgi:spore maturation protein CgeB
MKILVVGDGHSVIHEVAVVGAFKQLGHQVEPFYWQNYFSASNPLVGLWRRVQNKFLIGPTINRLNRDLVKKAVEFGPQLIFIYRGTHITPRTLIELKLALSVCELFGYNNDDPFAAGHPPWLWRHFMKCVPIYDVVFAYRHRNLDDLLKIGAKRVELLRSWYLPELHKSTGINPNYRSDCMFVGHYEGDGRAECLEALIMSGVNLKLFGPYKGLKESGWEIPISNSNILHRLLPVLYLSGQEYVKALSSTSIALCFLSKLNKDTYTRRCFEIPAIGAVLFSEYSDDLASMFIDGEEAVFFRNKEELVHKVKYYLAHEDQLQRIRENGTSRVIRDSHDIYSRLRTVLELVGK